MRFLIDLVAVVDATRAGGMPKVAVLMMSDTGFALVYLGSSQRFVLR
jgi:hypothetical protein